MYQVFYIFVKFVCQQNLKHDVRTIVT